MTGRRTALRASQALLAALVLSGCSTALLSSITPGTDVRSIRTFYVVQSPADTRGTHQLIQDELVKLGREARTGPRFSIPENVDVLVTYHDYWVLDGTWYLLDLVIQIRDPATNVLLATGQSRRTSLARTEPALMVKEALDNVLK